jgi:drug/metabolite transporter (DMT)-like permease
MPLSILFTASLTVLAWGSAFAAVHVGLEAFAPAELALLRYLVASAALLVYAAAAGLRLPARRDLPGILAIGLVGIAFYNLALTSGQRSVPAGTASLIIASAPIWMAMISIAARLEAASVGTLGGLVLGLAGVATLALARKGGSLTLGLDPGILALVVAAIAQSVYSLGQRAFLGRYRPLEVTAYAVWAGTLALLLVLLPERRGVLSACLAAPPRALIAVVYLGLVPGALGYVAWAKTLAALSPSRAGSILYLVPGAAMLIAWLVLGESPAAGAVLGGALVVSGVALTHRTQARAR